MLIDQAEQVGEALPSPGVSCVCVCSLMCVRETGTRQVLIGVGERRADAGRRISGMLKTAPEQPFQGSGQPFRPAIGVLTPSSWSGAHPLADVSPHLFPRAWTTGPSTPACCCATCRSPPTA